MIFYINFTLFFWLEFYNRMNIIERYKREADSAVQEYINSVAEEEGDREV